MLTKSKVNSIRRKRDKLFECTLTIVRERIDRYEQSGMQEIAYLNHLKLYFRTVGTDFNQSKTSYMNSRKLISPNN